MSFLEVGDLRWLFTKDKKVGENVFLKDRTFVRVYSGKYGIRRGLPRTKSQQQIKPVRSDTETGEALLTSSATPLFVIIKLIHCRSIYFFLIQKRIQN